MGDHRPRTLRLCPLLSAFPCAKGDLYGSKELFDPSICVILSFVCLRSVLNHRTKLGVDPDSGYYILRAPIPIGAGNFALNM